MPVKDERSVTKLDVRMGNRLRVRRLELGMSQEVLAAEIGVTFQQLQKYETGVNRMAASRLAQIAKAVDLPVSAFFDKEDAQFDAASSMLATPEGAQLVKIFSKIKSKALRTRVVGLVRSLAEDN